MAATYWHKQTVAKPLFADLLWSRPENRAHAGKLLIIGGNAHGFAAAATAYAEATKAGIGTARVLLPDSLQKTVGRVFEAGEYVPSTPSGSFSQKALAELLAAAAWSDGVLLAGDLGRNSEAAILLEKFIQKYSGPLTITQDAADYFTKAPTTLLKRAQTTLVVSFAQLQKLAISARFTQAFTYEMDLIRLVESLHIFTLAHQINLITKRGPTIFVATQGSVSTTQLENDEQVWRVKTAAHAAVWHLQNQQRPFEALTTSLIEAA